VEVQPKFLISAGGFLEYQGYPLRSGYQPADLGAPRIRLAKKIEDGTVKKDIHASI